MIHYHGTPCGGRRVDVVNFISGRHAFIPWTRTEDLGTVADVCQSFAFDNGAYSLWREGNRTSRNAWRQYFAWVKLWCRHPSYDFAIIPDVIEGTEKENDQLIIDWVNWEGWRGENWWSHGVPVWHLHESLDRLARLAKGWPRIAFGSSAEFSSVGTYRWWERMSEALEVVCVEGIPKTKLHGLRMLDPLVFTRIPFASADSTNAARNSSCLGRFGSYVPPNTAARMEVIASRTEAHQSPAVWNGREEQFQLFGVIDEESKKGPQ